MDANKPVYPNKYVAKNISEALDLFQSDYLCLAYR